MAQYLPNYSTSLINYTQIHQNLCVPFGLARQLLKFLQLLGKANYGVAQSMLVIFIHRVNTRSFHIRDAFKPFMMHALGPILLLRIYLQASPPQLGKSSVLMD